METVFISDFNNVLFISCFKRALSEFSVDTNQLGRYITEFNAAGNIFAYILIDEQGESVGMIQFQKTELSNQYIKEEYGLIREFWIEPQYRNKGIGKQLLNDCELYLSRLGINQFVLLSLPAAENFYKKQGYMINENYISFNNLKVMTKFLSN